MVVVSRHITGASFAQTSQPFMSVTRMDKTRAFHIECHNTSSFGKWKEDCKWTGKKGKDWIQPNKTELDESAREMKRLHSSVTNAASKANNAAPVTMTRGSDWPANVV